MTEIEKPHRMIAALAATALLWVANLSVATARTANIASDARNRKLLELCTDSRALLAAALMDRAGPNDVLSSDPPDYVFQPGKAVNGIRRITPFGPESGYWRIGWEGRAPSPALVRRWYQLPYGSISRCFQSVGVEQPLLEILGPKIRQFTPVDGPTLSTLRVSYPVFDRSKTHAILLYSRFFRHALGGRVELVSLTRTKSGWKKTGSTGLWQS